MADFRLWLLMTCEHTKGVIILAVFLLLGSHKIIPKQLCPCVSRDGIRSANVYQVGILLEGEQKTRNDILCERRDVVSFFIKQTFQS